MPALVIFGRRWNLGSDDLVVPGLSLFTLNLVTILVGSISFPWDTGQGISGNTSTSENPEDQPANGSDPFLGEKICKIQPTQIMIGHLIIIVIAAVLECVIAAISLRGTILESAPRALVTPLLYVRFAVYFLELTWSLVSIVWLTQGYTPCGNKESRLLVFVTVVHLVEIASLIISMYVLYDPAGRSWLKMRNYQRNMEGFESSRNIPHPKRFSSARNRNWRQRKVARAYQESWNHRCSIMFCCVSKSDKQKDSFTEIARLLAEFFRDLDVVPTDILAGLILLRRKQKRERTSILAKHKKDTYDFLSGVAVTPNTQFVALSDPVEQTSFQLLVRYMKYAAAAYGWPLYMLMNPVCGCCRLTSVSECIKPSGIVPLGDNCCRCHLAAAKQILELDDKSEILFASFEVGVGKTAFYVALDYSTKAIVITIRGTLSMEDVLTDLNADGELLPVTPLREDWIGHRGMVQAALYVKSKIEEEKIIERAQSADPEQGSRDFKIVIVGHSLGAGTSAILGVLLREKYENLECFSYAPPGGLLSSSVADYTKEFVTSVVVGKDLVPRIGLSQLEMLRVDLMDAIRESKEPKWKILTSSLLCCGREEKPPKSIENPQLELTESGQRSTSESATSHPLTTHSPLYPPGKIIHIVRHHVRNEERIQRRSKPVYQALWADRTDFNEVLISPVMVQDHMPDRILNALEMVLKDFGPAKPHRTGMDPSLHLAESEGTRLLESPLITPPRRIYRETSFTSLTPYPYAASLSSSSSRSSRSKTLTVGNLPYGIGIEYLSSLEDEILAEIKKRDINDPDDFMKVWRGHLFREWSYSAPVASPEPTSEVSSLRSYRLEGMKHKRSLSDQSRVVRTTFNQKLQTMSELSDSGSIGPLEPEGPIRYADTSTSTGENSSVLFDSPLIPVKKRSPVTKVTSLSPHLSSFRKEIIDLYIKAAKSVRSSSSASSGSENSNKSLS